MKHTILFVCPHNAAKSVLAAAYFNQLAQAKGLRFVGISAGTHPSPSVSTLVAEMLNSEGIDVTGYKPRQVTIDELRMAARTISLDCTPEELGGARQVDYWIVPLFSQNPEAAREAIRDHVQQLADELGNR